MKPSEISEFLMDTIEDIVYVSDPVTHALYYLNGEGCRKFNLTQRSQWHRKKCYQVLQGLDKPCPFCTNGQINQNEFYNWDYYNPVVNRHFYIQDKLIQFNGVLARMEIAKDVTARKELEQELTVRLDQQRTLGACIETLQSSLSPAESVDTLLSLISQFYQAERGYIFDVVEGNVSNNTYEWCAQGVEPQIDLLQGIPAAYTARWFEKFETEGGFYIDSLCDEVALDSVEYEILSGQGISSLITAPLRTAEGKIVGFIGVDNPKKYPHDVATMLSVTRFVVDFFEKIALFETLHKLSYGDALTGLKNRNSYSGTIAELQVGERCSLGVIYVDINGLKIVNDQFGHTLGDQYILSISSVISDLFPHHAYRIGGDEIVVLWPDVEQAVFEQTVKVLLEKMQVGTQKKAAVGYTWSQDARGVIQQIETTDALMYQQKQCHYQQNPEGGRPETMRYYWEHMKQETRFQEFESEILQRIQACEAEQV